MLRDSVEQLEEFVEFECQEKVVAGRNYSYGCWQSQSLRERFELAHSTAACTREALKQPSRKHLKHTLKCEIYKTDVSIWS